MELKKTNILWRKIKDVEVLPYNLQVQKGEIKAKMEELEQKLKRNKFNTPEEYKTAQKEMQQLQKDLVEIGEEIKIVPLREKELKSNVVPNVIPTYNEELKPIIEEYKKLDDKLTKKMDSFAKEIEPIVSAMSEIEKNESVYSNLLNQSVGNDKRITIPVKKRRLMFKEPSNQYSPTIGHIENLTGELSVLINNIKRNKQL